VNARGALVRALLATAVLCASLHPAPALAEPEPARWSGVDESVIEKVAAEAGRAPRPLLFDLEGDLALFVFLCAGIAGGAVFGYYFRVLFVERLDERPAHSGSGRRVSPPVPTSGPAQEMH
jgi:hypothetical protein